MLDKKILKKYQEALAFISQKNLSEIDGCFTKNYNDSLIDPFVNRMHSALALNHAENRCFDEENTNKIKQDIHAIMYKTLDRLLPMIALFKIEVSDDQENFNDEEIKKGSKIVLKTDQSSLYFSSFYDIPLCSFNILKIDYENDSLKNSSMLRIKMGSSTARSFMGNINFYIHPVVLFEKGLFYDLQNNLEHIAIKVPSLNNEILLKPECLTWLTPEKSFYAELISESSFELESIKLFLERPCLFGFFILAEAGEALKKLNKPFEDLYIEFIFKSPCSNQEANPLHPHHIQTNIIPTINLFPLLSEPFKISPETFTYLPIPELHYPNTRIFKIRSVTLADEKNHYCQLYPIHSFLRPIENLNCFYESLSQEDAYSYPQTQLHFLLQPEYYSKTYVAWAQLLGYQDDYTYSSSIDSITLFPLDQLNEYRGSLFENLYPSVSYANNCSFEVQQALADLKIFDETQASRSSELFQHLHYIFDVVVQKPAIKSKYLSALLEVEIKKVWVDHCIEGFVDSEVPLLKIHFHYKGRDNQAANLACWHELLSRYLKSIAPMNHRVELSYSWNV